MAGYNRPLSLSLVAGDDDGVCLSQVKVAAGNLTINGALATAGIATFDKPRRVLITNAGDDSLLTFTVYGTNYTGVAISENIAGTNATTTYTINDFKTVTRVAVDGAVASTVKVGTNAVGSTSPFFIDAYVNPPSIGVDTTVTGTVNYTIEFTTVDLSPQWDIYANPPTWFSVFGFDGVTASAYGTLNQPSTMIRLTINSGTGSVTARIRQAFIAGPI